jgi:hypothetical protein
MHLSVLTEVENTTNLNYGIDNSAFLGLGLVTDGRIAGPHHLVADSDPVFHFDVDLEIRFTLMRIRIRLFHFIANPDLQIRNHWATDPSRLHVEPQLLHCEPPRLHCEPPRLHCEPPRLYCEPPRLHCEPPRLHCEPPRLHCEYPQLRDVHFDPDPEPAFDFDAFTDPDLALEVNEYLILLPKFVRIRTVPDPRHW